MKIWIAVKNLMKLHCQIKKAFYSNLNLEDTSDVDYPQVQKVWGVLERKNRGEYHDIYVQSDTILFSDFFEIFRSSGGYHDLYVQSDTLLLSDVFESFRNKCLEIYKLDHIYFVPAPGLAWEACLKKTRVKLELITDYDMLLMIEKGIRGGICQATYRYAEANNKYLENYDKNHESSYIEYLDANSLYGWAMSQKLPVESFKWVKKKKLSKFNEDFTKKYDEDSNTGYFLEVDMIIQKNYLIFIKIYHST